MPLSLSEHCINFRFPGNPVVVFTATDKSTLLSVEIGGSGDHVVPLLGRNSFSLGALFGRAFCGSGFLACGLFSFWSAHFFGGDWRCLFSGYRNGFSGGSCSGRRWDCGFLGACGHDNFFH